MLEYDGAIGGMPHRCQAPCKGSRFGLPFAGVGCGKSAARRQLGPKFPTKWLSWDASSLLRPECNSRWRPYRWRLLSEGGAIQKSAHRSRLSPAEMFLRRFDGVFVDRERFGIPWMTTLILLHYPVQMCLDGLPVLTLKRHTLEIALK
jgi:hypothetical protein